MFEELVDNQNAEIQDKNTKLVQVSEEKNSMKEQMLKLEKHLDVMFVQCETHKSSPLNKLPFSATPGGSAAPDHHTGPITTLEAAPPDRYGDLLRINL